MHAAESSAVSPGSGTARPSRHAEDARGYQVERYQPALAREWDAFVRGSRNGTFLLERGFMDHHAERFHDYSLLVRDSTLRLVALLPANRQGAALHSHGGLTYGGFIYGAESRTLDASAILAATLDHLRAQGIVELCYKTIPSIYHRQPAEEDRFALFQAGASIVARHVLSVVPRDDRLARQARRRRGIAIARRAGIEVAESDSLAAFWELLGEVLQQRHGAAPVHSLEQIQLLRSRFPGHVRLFTAGLSGRTVAGVLVFETGRVARAQYICSGESGRHAGALDALFSHLLDTVYVDKPWFDFGTSHDADWDLNAGLIAHKEGFGARPIVQDHYLLRITA